MYSHSIVNRKCLLPFCSTPAKMIIKRTLRYVEPMFERIVVQRLAEISASELKFSTKDGIMWSYAVHIAAHAPRFGLEVKISEDADSASDSPATPKPILSQSIYRCLERGKPLDGNIFKYFMMNSVVNGFDKVAIFSIFKDYHGNSERVLAHLKNGRGGPCEGLTLPGSNVILPSWQFVSD
uniref:Uncharacterized protein n=1 Tax=Glossina pallidipes TaxID=7398 RepID=A0A1A9ZI21_GLOPL